MKLKQIILITILILSIILLISGLYRFYPTIELKLYEINLKWNTHKDIYYSLPPNPKGIILFIPDQRMNKYWNTYNIETNMGLRLSHLFYENGYIPIIFDRLDAYKEPKYYFAPSQLKLQLIEIINTTSKWKKENFSHLKFHILAHGDGCNILLQSINEINQYNKIDSIILTQCGYKDSLLSYYLSLIFNTMKLNKIEEEIIQTAIKEGMDWMNQNDYKPISEEEWNKIQKELIENKVHPDLIAFRKTISIFQREDNIAFLLESKKIYFLELLNNAIKNKINIYHFISSLDEEMPYEQFIAIEEFNKTINQPNYHLSILKNTDHFLFYIDKKLESPIEYLIHRQNPFNKISEEFIIRIKEILN